MPNYTFPGYIVRTELLKEGSSASPLTRTVFLTDLLVSLLLGIFVLVLSIIEKTKTRKDIDKKLLRFEEEDNN